MYANVCNDSLNITIVMGRKYHYALAWDTFLTPEISKYRPFACQNVAHVKNDVK